MRSCRQWPPGCVKPGRRKPGRRSLPLPTSLGKSIGADDDELGRRGLRRKREDPTGIRGEMLMLLIGKARNQLAVEIQRIFPGYDHRGRRSGRRMAARQDERFPPLGCGLELNVKVHAAFAVGKHARLIR